MTDRSRPAPARGQGRAAGPSDDREPALTGGACPICRAPGLRRWRPFCSRRCADVDLGRWVTGRYALPGEPGESGADGRALDDGLDRD